jgi:hypothetical protein
MLFEYLTYFDIELQNIAEPAVAIFLLTTVLTLVVYSSMAEATAADGQMKDLSLSETKKSKKDGNPQKAAKKPQQQKKKVSYTDWRRIWRFRRGDCATD